jgi:hypothetical protein
MTQIQKLSLLFALTSPTFSFAASVPKTILPDNVITCQVNANCTNKTLYGRTYKVINTPRFTVMVAVSQEGGYTRADVSIANNTIMSQSLTPEDFRVEVVTPKPKVLLYVPPTGHSNNGDHSSCLRRGCTSAGSSCGAGHERQSDAEHRPALRRKEAEGRPERRGRQGS